jgi:hypothetical protein
VVSRWSPSPIEPVLGAGADTRVLLGGFLEVIVAVCVIGTGVTLYPVIRSQNPG